MVSKRAISPPRSDDGILTPMQRKFVNAYLGEANGSGAEAARIAGFSNTTGYPSILLRKPAIRAEIQARLEEEAMTAAACIARLSALASARIGDFMTVVKTYSLDKETGETITTEERVLDLEKCRTGHNSQAIREISFQRNGTPKIKLHNPNEALALLAKFHGLLIDRVEVTQRVDPETVRASILAKFNALMSEQPREDQPALPGLGHPVEQQ
jgi:hypothetical protein